MINLFLYKRVDLDNKSANTSTLTAMFLVKSVTFENIEYAKHYLLHGRIKRRYPFIIAGLTDGKVIEDLYDNPTIKGFYQIITPDDIVISVSSCVGLE